MCTEDEAEKQVKKYPAGTVCSDMMTKGEKLMVEKNYFTLDAYATGSYMQDTFTMDKMEWQDEKVRLEQNYPNPFNPVTIIRFDLAEQSRVNLKIFSHAGKLVAVLKDDTLPAGSYQVAWNASLMPGGKYYYSLQVNHQTFTKTMTLIN